MFRIDNFEKCCQIFYILLNFDPERKNMQKKKQKNKAMINPIPRRATQWRRSTSCPRGSGLSRRTRCSEFIARSKTWPRSRCISGDWTGISSSTVNPLWLGLRRRNLDFFSFIKWGAWTRVLTHLVYNIFQLFNVFLLYTGLFVANTLFHPVHFLHSS